MSKKEKSHQQHIKKPSHQDNLDSKTGGSQKRSNKCEVLASLSAFLLVVLTAVLAYYAWQTYIATLDTAHKQLRAYVGIDAIDVNLPSVNKTHYKPVEPTLGTRIPDVVLLKIKNYSATPALCTQAYANWLSEPYLQQPPEDYPFPDLPTRASREDRLTSKMTFLTPKSSSPVVSAGINDYLKKLPQTMSVLPLIANKTEGIELMRSKVTMFPGSTWRTQVPVDDITYFTDAAQQKSTLYLYGHIDYKDIYGADHHTNFVTCINHGNLLSIVSFPITDSMMPTD